MRLAVIGGGLAGLVVAQRRIEAGDEVTIYEARDRLGGQIATERAHGFVVEHGAEGFVARSDVLVELARKLGIGNDLIDQLTLTSYFFDGTSLVALAPGEAARKLGFQVPNDELGRGIRSFRWGMAELVEALAQHTAPRAQVRLGCEVEQVQFEGTHCELRAGGTNAEKFDQLVLATNANAAGILLEPWLGSPASALRESKALSSVTVSLAYPRSAIDHPLAGSGFIVAEGQQEEGFRACAFVSSKLCDRAPRDRSLLRLFFRPELEALHNDTDASWVARAERCLARVLRLTQTSEHAWVSRWPSALPVFDAEHTRAVSVLETALESSRVRLAGAAFHGSGIDAAVRSALRTADALSGV